MRQFLPPCIRRAALLAVGAAVLSIQSGCASMAPRKSSAGSQTGNDYGLSQVGRVLGTSGSRAKSAPCPRGTKAAVVTSVASKPCPRAGVSRAGFIWPTGCGSVSRGFGANQGNHRGLDICAPTGTPVRASRAGTVLYAGNKLSGFGNVVIIEHGGGLATVYGHNRRNLVQSGQKVSQGQTIAEVGQTGNATTPHCHFEVRRDSTAVDPMPMLL